MDPWHTEWEFVLEENDSSLFTPSDRSAGPLFLLNNGAGRNDLPIPLSPS